MKSRLSTLLHWLAWGLLVNAGIVLFVRYFGMIEYPPYVQLVAFPEWIAGTLAIGALIELFRKHAELVAAHCIAIALILYAQPNIKSEWPVTTIGQDVEILTANIKQGAAIDDLVTLIVREKPDLVFVQECNDVCETKLTDKPIKKLLRYQVIDARPGSEGGAILSVFPLTKPAELFRQQAIGNEFAMPEAILELPELGTVAVKSAHPFPPTPQEERFWASGLQALAKFSMHYGSMPVIVAGDFNSGAEHKQFRDVMDSGRLRDAGAELGIDKVTWKMDGRPYIQATLDHVLFSGATARSYLVFPLAKSDHSAVLVTIRF
jgi:endonuclease/exonuclease/phosphatase (EEP) superfamily protein YafD